MKLLQIVLGIFVFVAVGVYAVLQQVRVVQLGYDLHAATTECEKLDEANRELQARISRLRNPVRLRDVAFALKLGVVPPDDPEWHSAPRSLQPLGRPQAESEPIADTRLTAPSRGR
ncbi:MAG: hypothetical protein AB7K09_02255 [Planctomycetota bacterium]